MKSNEIDEKAKEILKRQPAIGRVEMGRLLGISEGSARRVLDRVRKAPTPTAPRPVAKAKAHGNALSREQFRARHDIVTRTREAIKQGIEALNPEELLPEFAFRQSINMAGAPCFRTVAAEFAQYQVQAGGTIYWARPETVRWAINNVQGAKRVAA